VPSIISILSVPSIIDGTERIGEDDTWTIDEIAKRVRGYFI